MPETQPISWRYWGFTPKQHHVAMESEYWKLLRLRRRKKCNDRCERCQNTGRLELHHLTYERLGKEREEDVQLICQPCHAAVHRGRKIKGLKAHAAVAAARGLPVSPVHRMRQRRASRYAERLARKALAQAAREIEEFGRRKVAF